jgi:hypothetical protein
MNFRRLPLPDPLLLFLIALLSGTLWLFRPIPNVPARAPREVRQAAAAPPPAPRAQPPKQSAGPNLATVREELEAAEKAIVTRAAALDAQTAEIEMLQRKVDALRAELAALEAQGASMGPAPALPASSAEESRMEGLVKDGRVEVSRLESELTSLKSAPRVPVSDAKRVPRAVRVSQKMPALVDLSGNRIAPVNGEFFHFPMFALSSETVATRKRPGETIAEARAVKSHFARFLAKIRPDSEYISCLLNSDSFEAFYAVRDMASRAGFDIAWEPADTRSGKIPIQRVKLVSKPHSGDGVKLPDIMRDGAGEH